MLHFHINVRMPILETTTGHRSGSLDTQSQIYQHADRVKANYGMKGIMYLSDALEV